MELLLGRRWGGGLLSGLGSGLSSLGSFYANSYLQSQYFDQQKYLQQAQFGQQLKMSQQWLANQQALITFNRQNQVEMIKQRGQLAGNMLSASQGFMAHKYDPSSTPTPTARSDSVSSGGWTGSTMSSNNPDGPIGRVSIGSYDSSTPSMTWGSEMDRDDPLPTSAGDPSQDPAAVDQGAASGSESGNTPTPRETSAAEPSSTPSSAGVKILSVVPPRFLECVNYPDLTLLLS